MITTIHRIESIRLRLMAYNVVMHDCLMKPTHQIALSACRAMYDYNRAESPSKRDFCFALALAHREAFVSASKHIRSFQDAMSQIEALIRHNEAVGDGVADCLLSALVHADTSVYQMQCYAAEQMAQAASEPAPRAKRITTCLAAMVLLANPQDTSFLEIL